MGWIDMSNICGGRRGGGVMPSTLGRCRDSLFPPFLSSHFFSLKHHYLLTHSCVDISSTSAGWIYDTFVENFRTKLIIDKLFVGEVLAVGVEIFIQEFFQKIFFSEDDLQN